MLMIWRINGGRSGGGGGRNGRRAVPPLQLNLTVWSRHGRVGAFKQSSHSTKAGVSDFQVCVTEAAGNWSHHVKVCQCRSGGLGHSETPAAGTTSYPQRMRT